MLGDLSSGKFSPYSRSPVPGVSRVRLQPTCCSRRMIVSTIIAFARVTAAYPLSIMFRRSIRCPRADKWPVALGLRSATGRLAKRRGRNLTALGSDTVVIGAPGQTMLGTQIIEKLSSAWRDNVGHVLNVCCPITACVNLKLPRVTASRFNELVAPQRQCVSRVGEDFPLECVAPQMLIACSPFC